MLFIPEKEVRLINLKRIVFMALFHARHLNKALRIVWFLTECVTFGSFVTDCCWTAVHKEQGILLCGGAAIWLSECSFHKYHWAVLGESHTSAGTDKQWFVREEWGPMAPQDLFPMGNHCTDFYKVWQMCVLFTWLRVLVRLCPNYYSAQKQRNQQCVSWNCEAQPWHFSVIPPTWCAHWKNMSGVICWKTYLQLC